MAPPDPERWNAARRVLADGVRDGVMPGAVALVGRGADVLWEAAVGRLGSVSDPRVGRRTDEGAGSAALDSGGAAVGRGRTVVADSPGGDDAELAGDDLPVDAHTIYDLASLTKALSTTTLIFLLAAEERLDIDRPAADYLPALASRDDALAQASVACLLGHGSGLPAHRRYYERLGADALAGCCRAEILAAVAAEPLEAAPGEQVVYSDLGFILLGALVEEVTGRRLDDLFAERIARPLGLATLGFRGREPDAATLARTAPTGLCPWRGRVVRGTVEDENAHAMGGVAGHAGLFGTAREVHAVAAALVAAAADPTAGFGDLAAGTAAARRFAQLLGRAWKPGAARAGATWGLGWDTPSPGASSAGRQVSPEAAGHLGFTGTSLWIDRRRGIHSVLLTNRVHPDDTDDRIRTLRPTFHDAVWATVD